MGIGRMVLDEALVTRTFAMSDFACLLSAVALFAVAALYARACGDL